MTRSDPNPADSTPNPIHNPIPEQDQSTDPVPQVFGPDIWIHDGPQVEGAAGFQFPTRMALIRLADGGLFVWSPVALTPALANWITETGRVRHIVAPNALHHVFLPAWQVAYPQAQIHGAPGVAEKREEIRFASLLGDAVPEDWKGQIEQVLIPNRIADEVVFFHRASATVIVTDLLQAMPPGSFRGWRALVARLDLMTGDTPRVPRKFRMALRPRDVVRGRVEHVLGWPAERLILAHGRPVTRDAHALLRRAFRWLY